MGFSAQVFARKLTGLRADFGEELASISAASGIPVERLKELESASVQPTGDEVLILADYFKRDFEYLIEDDAADPDTDVDILFRERGDELVSSDRHAIAEFSYLCVSQAFLEDSLGRRPNRIDFVFQPKNRYFKGDGAECAKALRRHLGLPANAVVPDIYACLRSIGLKVFRRKLKNSAISGLFMNHPDAGRCILVNLAEGLARQRFSAAHECAHALMDGQRLTFSLVRDWNSNDLVEIRANAFASHFLIPIGLLNNIDRTTWDDPKQVVAWSKRLKVSVPALLKALVDGQFIDASQREALRSLNLRYVEAEDPELYGELSPAERQRKLVLLERGLTQSYVDLCFDAYGEGAVSRGRIAEMLLVSVQELSQVAQLFGRSLRHE